MTDGSGKYDRDGILIENNTMTGPHPDAPDEIQNRQKFISETYEYAKASGTLDQWHLHFMGQGRTRD